MVIPTERWGPGPVLGSTVIDSSRQEERRTAEQQETEKKSHHLFSATSVPGLVLETFTFESWEGTGKTVRLRSVNNLPEVTKKKQQFQSLRMTCRKYPIGGIFFNSTFWVSLFLGHGYQYPGSWIRFTLANPEMGRLSFPKLQQSLPIQTPYWIALCCVTLQFPQP